MAARRRASPDAGRTLPIELVRAATSFALAREWDVNGILHEAGIPPMLLTEGRARVTEAQAVSIVRTLWRLTDDEAFGMGEHPLPRGSFRLLCYGAIGAPDLGSALERIAGFARAMPALPSLHVEQEGEHSRVALGLGARLDDPAHLIVYTALALAHRMMAWVIDQPLDLVRVELPFHEPKSTEMADLVFGVSQRYVAPQPAIVLASAWLRAPLMRDEQALDEFLARSPEGLLARPAVGSNTTDRVRKLVVQGLKHGQPSGAEIAARLSMSEQTLRRKLTADGTSLRRIRESVLRDAAVTALAQGDEPIAEISARLGFSEPSAFTRAFHRWTGSPPSLYRDRERPVGGGS